MGKTRADGVGNEQAPRNALEGKYNSHTKEARRVVSQTFTQNPSDVRRWCRRLSLHTINVHRESPKDMGLTEPIERYKDIILQAFPADYERFRTASY